MNKNRICYNFFYYPIDISSFFENYLRSKENKKNPVLNTFLFVIFTFQILPVYINQIMEFVTYYLINYLRNDLD